MNSLFVTGTLGLMANTANQRGVCNGKPQKPLPEVKRQGYGPIRGRPRLGAGGPINAETTDKPAQKNDTRPTLAPLAPYSQHQPFSSIMVLWQFMVFMAFIAVMPPSPRLFKKTATMAKGALQGSPPSPSPESNYAKNTKATGTSSCFCVSLKSDIRSGEAPFRLQSRPTLPVSHVRFTRTIPYSKHRP